MVTAYLDSVNRPPHDKPPPVAPDPVTVRTFLRGLFGDAQPDTHVLIWTKSGDEKRSDWFPVEQIDAAADHAAAADGDVYFGVAVSPENYGPKSRCKAAQTRGINSLWLDVDIRGDAHKSADLPATEAEAVELVQCLGIEPSVVVHSGHGLQAYWLLSSPWMFASSAERDLAADLARRFLEAFRRRAKLHNWKLDGVADLARVFRVPGTINHKTEPVQARIVAADWNRRYEPGDFLALLEGDEDQEPEPPPVVNKGTNGHRRHDDPLDVIEQARRYVAKMPEAVSGNNGHDAAFLVAQVLVRGFSLGVDQARPLMQEFSDRCKPPWSDREINHKLHSASTESRLPLGYILNRPRQQSQVKLSLKTVISEPPDDAVTLGSLALYVVTARRTPSGKITAAVSIRRGAILVDELNVSSTATGRKDAARLLRAHLADDAEAAKQVDAVVARLVVAAADVIDAKPSPEAGGKTTIETVVAQMVPDALRLVCRTDRGAWSEARGGEITRGDFCSFTPSWLLEEAGKAADAPRDAGDVVNRPLLLRSIKGELEVLWADLLHSLPAAAGADLGRDSAAGRKFREAMVRLWARTVTFEVQKTVEGTGGEAVAARASLVSRVRSKFKAFKDGRVTPEPRERWREVQTAFSAWWRPWIDGNGEVVPLLAMRWELVCQIGIELPGVSDQASLTALGERYGVTDPSPPVATVVSGGKQRLAVMTPAFAAELMENPVEIEDQDDSVTQ